MIPNYNAGDTGAAVREILNDTIDAVNAIGPDSGRRLFVAGTFYDATSEACHLHISLDGITWKDLGALLYQNGKVRDPSFAIIDDVFYCAFTAGGVGDNTTSFKIIRSTDLVTWTLHATVDCSSVSGVNRTWSPIFATGFSDVRIIVSLSNDGDVANMVPYEVHPVTPGDLTAWSAPTEITGTGFPMLIAGQWEKVGATYRLWYKNEASGQKRIEVAESSSMLTGYTVVESGDWAGWGSGLEGPFLVDIGSKRRIYFTQYPNNVFYSESTDGGATWSAKAAVTPATFTLSSVMRTEDVGLIGRVMDAVATINTNGTGDQWRFEVSSTRVQNDELGVFKQNRTGSGSMLRLESLDYFAGVRLYKGGVLLGEFGVAPDGVCYFNSVTNGFDIYTNNGGPRLRISSSGQITIPGLVGTGTRNVVVSSTGVLSAP